METQTVTPCAEFPNDNPALHRGAIWRCTEVTGAPTCELPEEPELAEVVQAVVMEALPLELEPEPEEPEPVEAVAAIEEIPARVEEPAAVGDVASPASEEPPSLAALADALAEVALAEPEVAPEPVAAVAAPRPIEAAVVLEASEPSTDPSPPVLEAEDEGDDIEIVEDLAFDGVIDESPEAPTAEAEVDEDPFVALTRVLESVATSAGASEPALASLRVAMGRERVSEAASDELLVLREQAAAWQGILRGDSEDFAACGIASLDEWSAVAIARCMGEMARVEGLRRELRRRGVAAFGLVIEAA